ncbi:MAG: response regulator transcription factor [Lachnospiraceae bacterium]|nr:response regulator transcription factor [Lachnospiraceae bacterium]
MRIAICDDEQLALIRTKETLETAYKSIDLIVDIYSNGNKLIEVSKTYKYDLIFLDVEMPLIDGIEIAKQLRKNGDETAIVFLTSHVEYALKGYEVNALRYLLKPAKVEQIREIINHLIESQKKIKQLLVKSKEDTVMINVNHIVYMEAQNQDIIIVTKDEKYCNRYNLKDYEEELKEYNFIRCHRSYLVNISHIMRISGKEIIMDNSDNIPLSRTKEKKIKEALCEYVKREAL